MFDEALAIDPSKRPGYMSMTSSGDELEAYARWAGFENISVHRWHDAWVGVSAVKGPAASWSREPGARVDGPRSQSRLE
jgi:hypothetical protein